MREETLDVRTVTCCLMAVGIIGLTGCDSQPTAAASRPTTPAYSSTTEGGLRGFVYGKEGLHQPLRGARVQAGHLTTLTGRPADVYGLGLSEGQVHEAEGVETVLHDFEDRHGPVGAERRLDEDGQSYIYLRAGEFAFTRLPDGPVSLAASLCDMTSAPLLAHVTAGRSIDGLALALPQYIMVQNGDSTFPQVVTWKSTEPVEGFVVSLAADGEGLVYTPSPPNLTATLQTPVGSRGTTITGIEIEYTWLRADGQLSSLKAARLPIAPLMIPTASLSCPGAPVRVQIPLGTGELASAFREQGAGQVVAKARFFDESGFMVQGLDLDALTVATNIRRL